MRPAARWAERRKAQGAERINRNKRFERQRETALIEVADSWHQRTPLGRSIHLESAHQKAPSVEGAGTEGD